MINVGSAGQIRGRRLISGQSINGTSATLTKSGSIAWSVRAGCFHSKMTS